MGNNFHLYNEYYKCSSCGTESPVKGLKNCSCFFQSGEYNYFRERSDMNTKEKIDAAIDKRSGGLPEIPIYLGMGMNVQTRRELSGDCVSEHTWTETRTVGFHNLMVYRDFPIVVLNDLKDGEIKFFKVGESCGRDEDRLYFTKEGWNNMIKTLNNPNLRFHLEEVKGGFFD